MSLRVLGLALGARRRHDDGVRPGAIAGAGPPAHGQRSARPAAAAARATARALLPGPGGRRGRAGLRARSSRSALLVRTVGAMTRVPLGVAPKNVVLASVQLVGRIRRAAPGRPSPSSTRPSSSGCAQQPGVIVGRQHEHPADGARLAEPVPAGRPAVRPPRRPAAGAVPLGQRGLLRDDGRDAASTGALHRARHAGERGRGHRQRDAGDAVLPGRVGGRPRDLCRRRRRSARWGAT